MLHPHVIIHLSLVIVTGIVTVSGLWLQQFHSPEVSRAILVVTGLTAALMSSFTSTLNSSWKLDYVDTYLEVGQYKTAKKLLDMVKVDLYLGRPLLFLTAMLLAVVFMAPTSVPLYLQGSWVGGLIVILVLRRDNRSREDSLRKQCP